MSWLVLLVSTRRSPTLIRDFTTLPSYRELIRLSERSTIISCFVYAWRNCFRLETFLTPVLSARLIRVSLHVSTCTRESQDDWHDISILWLRPFNTSSGSEDQDISIVCKSWRGLVQWISRLAVFYYCWYYLQLLQGVRHQIWTETSSPPKRLFQMN